jgi:hypothetical protein
MLHNFFQSVIDGLVFLLQGLINLLPHSPFRGVYSLTIDNDLLGFLAWIIPYPQIIAVLQAWLVAITSFYLFQIILRWVKAVE